jgi:hypothetical protein
MGDDGGIGDDESDTERVHGQVHVAEVLVGSVTIRAAGVEDAMEPRAVADEAKLIRKLERKEAEQALRDRQDFDWQTDRAGLAEVFADRKEWCGSAVQAVEYASHDEARDKRHGVEYQGRTTQKWLVVWASQAGQPGRGWVGLVLSMQMIMRKRMVLIDA